MNGQENKAKAKRTALIQLALSTGLVAYLSTFGMPGLPAAAQAPQFGSSFQGGGPDQDSLPPEVIPVDAKTAAKMSQAQPNAQAGVPGMMGSAMSSGNQFASQNAQQIKQGYFNSLMGQNNYPQLQGGPIGSKFGNGQNGMPAVAPNAGQMNQAGAPLQGANGPQTLGQSNWITPAPNQIASNANPGQTQTLSGAVQNQNQNQQQSKRQGAGFSHGLSALTGFGMSAFAMGMMSARNPASLYGMGLQGAALGNYGMRNGFQF